MKYIKSKIIALPSERAKENGLCFNGDRFNTYLSSEAHYFNIGGEFDWQPYDLYFLSDEEIKVNDFYIDLFVSERERKVKIHTKERHLKNHMKDYRFGYCKKIIATTDEFLKYECDCCNGTGVVEGEINDEPCRTCASGYTGSLPKPSNEFIKKYCELGGINEVLVEYEYEKEWVYYEEIYESSQQYTNLKLKVAPDNTIKPLINQK